MSKRTRNFLIITLVLFVCCFGGSVGNPFGSDDDSASNPVVDLLSRFASENAAVPDSAIQASCRIGPDTFRFTGSCTLHVAAGGGGLRSLTLVSTEAMGVSSTVPGKDLTASDDVDAGEKMTVAVGEKGSAVTLTCAALRACVVTREDGS